jgi:hypothetical protein
VRRVSLPLLGFESPRLHFIWRPNADGSAQDLADALVMEPAVLLNPDTREDARVLKDLYQP